MRGLLVEFRVASWIFCGCCRAVLQFEAWVFRFWRRGKQTKKGTNDGRREVSDPCHPQKLALRATDMEGTSRHKGMGRLDTV